jgi:outer membrane biosynthesis protein TonB
MSYRLDDDRYRHEAVTVRTLWLTIALSLLVHLAAFLWVPQFLIPPLEGDEPGLASDRLQVRLAAIPQPVPPPPPEQPREIVAMPAPKPPAQPRAAARAPAPVLTAPLAAAPSVAPPPPTPPVPAPRQANPVEGDLWSYIQARRRERGEQPTTTPVDREAAERNANLAANLPAPATGIATRDAERGGGIFALKRMDYDDAAFEFFGWNNEMGRKTPQLIEVRRGNNSDMRIAVVRRMIAIIREHSQGDFTWRSQHYENGITLSARVSDNAELEKFLMHDFFGDPRALR